MQICLTSLWSLNHSKVPGSLIQCFVTKKLLCAHLWLKWTWEVCFQVTKLLAAPCWLGSLLLGVLGFPVAVILSPTGSSGHGSFWEESYVCWLESYGRMNFLPLLCSPGSGHPTCKESSRYCYSGNLCLDGQSSWRFEYPNCCSVVPHVPVTEGW